MASLSQHVPAPLTGFKRLGSATYIYEPPTTATAKPTTSPASAPDLILLASWLDAAPKHIAKYATGYKALYPSARILVITTSLADVTIHSHAHDAARIAPAVSVLLALPSHHKLLLHSFSNGGAITSCAVARAYAARSGRGILPIGAQILDSSPGHGHYVRTATALAMSLPQKPAILHAVSLLALHMFLVVYYTTKMVMGAENLITVTREELNDKGLFEMAAPRLYAYSRADRMVHFEDVEEHAQEAEEKGWDVCREVFVGSAHCGHLMADETRYWGAVKALWERGGEAMGSY